MAKVIGKIPFGKYHISRMIANPERSLLNITEFVIEGNGWLRSPKGVKIGIYSGMTDGIIGRLGDKLLVIWCKECQSDMLASQVKKLGKYLFCTSCETKLAEVGNIGINISEEDI
jgi:hypothetical protein